MGTDDDIDFTGRQVGHHRVAFLAGAKTGQLLYPHRPVCEAIDEGLMVLLCEQGGGHEHGYLPAVVNGDEGGAHGDFRLAEAHISAHQPVHGLSRCHVGEHRVDGDLLIRCFLEGESLYETSELVPVGMKLVARARRPARMTIQKLGGHVESPGGGLLARLLPLGAAELVQRREIRFCSGVTGNKMQRGDGHVELVAVGVFDAEKLAAHAFRADGLQTPVTADAVILVDHGCADVELG